MLLWYGLPATLLNLRALRDFHYLDWCAMVTPSNSWSPIPGSLRASPVCQNCACSQRPPGSPGKKQIRGLEDDPDNDYHTDMRT